VNRVAVVIPCFNDGATVASAVASVITQEISADLVVVDDGSNDPVTREVLGQLAAGGVRVIRQANAGLSAARNAGTAATSAAYVIVLDADDELVSGSLAALCAHLDAHPELALCWGDSELFGDCTGTVRTDDHLDSWRLLYFVPCHPAALIRRSALIAVGGWRKGFFEDWHMWMALAERGFQGQRIPRATVRYRLHGSRMHHEIEQSFAALYETLLAEHPSFVANRWRNWLSSQAPLRELLLFPLADILPLPRRMRITICVMIRHGGVRPVVTGSLRRLLGK
jgi:glycosyltransferase involved in cell wall biosynthesis